MDYTYKANNNKLLNESSFTIEEFCYDNDIEDPKTFIRILRQLCDFDDIEQADNSLLRKALDKYQQMLKESSDYTYRAKIGDNLYLQGNFQDGWDTTSDPDEAATFESKTEPTQIINQMKKDGKISKNAKLNIVKESIDPTGAAFNLTKLKGYLRFETRWEYDEDYPEDAMLVDKVHEPPRFTVNWIGPEGKKHPNTYCVNLRKDRGESWTWVTHFCLKASDAAEMINLEVSVWEHNNMSWKFESKKTLNDESSLNEARAFPHSSGFGLSGHYSYEEPKDDSLYIATETNEDDGELYFDEKGNTTEFETDAKRFTSEEDALEFAKNNVIFGEPGTKLLENHKLNEDGFFKPFAGFALTMAALTAIGIQTKNFDEKCKAIADELGVRLDKNAFDQRGSAYYMPYLQSFKYDGGSKDYSMTPEGLCKYIRKTADVDNVEYKTVEGGVEILFVDRYSVNIGNVIKHKEARGSFFVPNSYFEVSFIFNERDGSYKAKPSLKESKAKSYEFEIWWNTGDYYWDNDPDEEYFTGTIEQLNDYINSEVKRKYPFIKGWDEEPADIDEDDIDELRSTGRMQKTRGNEIWDIHSAAIHVPENIIKESKFKSVESFRIHEFEQQIKSFLKEDVGLTDSGQLEKGSSKQMPKPNSFYSISESGSIQELRLEISTDGQYYDDIIIEIYSAQPVPMGCYEILVDDETWLGKTFEEFEKDFYEAWKKAKSKPLKEAYATTKLKPSVFIKRHGRYFKHPCTVDDFYHLLKKSNRNYSIDSDQPLPLSMLDNLLDELRERYVDAGVDILKNDKHVLLGESTNIKESNAPKITFKTIEDALHQWYEYQLDFNSNFSEERTEEAYNDICNIIKESESIIFNLINKIIHKIEWYGYDSWQFKKNIYNLINESKNMKNNRFNESLHNNDDIINNLISKIEVYKDIVSNSWIPMPWEIAYSKVPEGLKLTIDTDEWFDKENPLGRFIDFILDIYNSDYDSSVRELTGIDVYSDVEFLGGEKSGYATYLIKNNESNNLKESRTYFGDEIKEVVDWLIESPYNNWQEKDREYLMNCDNEKLFKYESDTFDLECAERSLYESNNYGNKNMKLDEATVAQAKRFATRKHGERGQIRKATGAPYIVHPEGVAKIVKDFGGDDEQIQAAWLHDTMEDTGTWEEDLREKFGDRVADLVSELTNDDFAIRSIGKKDYMSNKLVNLSDDALLIKLSDFLYNIKDYCPMKTLERMKKNLEALNFSGRKLDDKCNRLLIDCLKAIDEEM